MTSQAIPFSLIGTPLLAEGTTQTLLARAPSLWAHAKVYAAGGENGVHAHPDEDHLFLVLAGEATFVDADGDTTVVGAFQGMMVPRNTAYAFKSSSAENLIMIRVGAPADSRLLEGGDVHEGTASGIPAAVSRRVTADGDPAPGLAPSNKTGSVPGVPIPGRVFGA